MADVSIFENNNENAFSNNAIKPIPSTINVLTILTFVNCGFGVLGSIYGLLTSKIGYDNFTSTNASLKNTNMPWFNKFFTVFEAYYKLVYDNMYFIFVINIIGLLLCFFGALQIRKLKKMGLPIYIIGEWMPVLLYTVLLAQIGLSLLGLLFALVPIVFTILYYKQKKHLVN